MGGAEDEPQNGRQAGCWRLIWTSLKIAGYLSKVFPYQTFGEYHFSSKMASWIHLGGIPLTSRQSNMASPRLRRDRGRCVGRQSQFVLICFKLLYISGRVATTAQSWQGSNMEFGSINHVAPKNYVGNIWDYVGTFSHLSILLWRRRYFGPFGCWRRARAGGHRVAKVYETWTINPIIYPIQWTNYRSMWGGGFGCFFLNMLRCFWACLGRLEENKNLRWVCLTPGVTNPGHCMPCARDHKVGGFDPSCVLNCWFQASAVWDGLKPPAARSSCVDCWS